MTFSLWDGEGIVLTAYSPLGSSDSYTGAMPGAPSLLKNEVVNAIAGEVSRSAAHVLIRWAVQKGVVVRVHAQCLFILERWILILILLVVLVV